MFWFCCFFVCNSLLLSQSPSVPLLQCSSFMRPPGWQSALLIGYLCREGTTWQPLQCARLPLSPSGEITESPPPLPSLPFHLSTPSFSLPFLSSCPPLHTHTHTQSSVNRAPPALSEQMGAEEDSGLVSLIPHTLHSLRPQHSPFLSLLVFI